MRTHVRSILISAALATAFATHASAQPSVSFSAVGANLNHQLLGGMHGGSLAVTWLSPSRAWSLRMAAEGMNGDGFHTATLCIDYIPPGGCNPEVVRDKSDLKGVSVGVGRSITSTRRRWVSAFADLPVARVNVDSHGQTTGRLFQASKTLMGIRSGLHAGVVPLPAWPLAIDVSASLGWTKPVTLGGCADCYEPFDAGFATRSVQIGVAWRGFE